MANIQIIAYDPSTHAVVPREITDAMRKASGDCAGPWDEWRAMVSAAPPPPAIGVVKGLEWEKRWVYGKWTWRAKCHFGEFIFWEFADGYGGSLAGPTHWYLEPRQSTIELAQSACQREFERLVSECLAGRVHGGGE